MLREVEDTVVEFLERGANLEADILANLKAGLPADLRAALDGLIPPPPTASSSYAPPPPAAASNGMDAGAAMAYSYAPEAVAANQVASSMLEIRGAVTGVKAALDAIGGNADASKRAMLKVNLREARDLLARRLNEASPAAAEADGAVAAAVREASVLLEEVGGVMASL